MQLKDTLPERERTLGTTNNVAPCLASCNSHNVGEPDSVAFPSLSALRDRESAEMLQQLQMKDGCKLQVYPPLDPLPTTN